MLFFLNYPKDFFHPWMWIHLDVTIEILNIYRGTGSCGQQPKCHRVNFSLSDRPNSFSLGLIYFSICAHKFRSTWLKILPTPLNKQRHHIHLTDVISRVWVFSFMAIKSKMETYNFIALGEIPLKFYQSQKFYQSHCTWSGHWLLEWGISEN